MQVLEVLHKLLTNTCPTMHQTRRDALQASILGVLYGQRLTVTDIGRAMVSDTSPKHQIKRADRLLSNPHLHQAIPALYRALCHQWIAPHSRPLILVDWSDMDDHRQHFVIRASLSSQGRSLTVYEEVHTVETKEKRRTHQQFLQQLKGVLPEGCRPILVTDAGFRTTWFRLVDSLGWDWVGRVRNRHDLRWTRGGPWFDAKQCYQQATSQPKYLGEGMLTRSNTMRCHLVVYRGKLQGRKHLNRLGEAAKNAASRKKAAGQREPWLLATSLPSSAKLAKQVVAMYGRRMEIEEGYRDVKSHRFGLGLTYHRTQSVARLQVLLLIACLALIVITLLGMAAIIKGVHYQFQANTVRHKRVLSVSFIGLQMLKYPRKWVTSQEIYQAWQRLRKGQEDALWYA